MKKYAALLCLALAACGQQETKAPAQAASTASNVATSSPVAASEAPAPASAVLASEASTPVAASEAYDGPVKSFTAFGNAPKPWRVVVKGEAEATGNSLTLEGETLKGSLEAERSAYAKGVEFTAQQDNVAVNLNIKGEVCKDDAGNEHEFTATLSYGKEQYKGCAERGVIEHAPT